MKGKWPALVLGIITGLQLSAQTPGKLISSTQVLLPNGWKLSPAGRSVRLGDLPLNMQLSHSGKMLAVTNNGQSIQSIQLIDPINEKVLDERPVGKSWYGLAFSKDDRTLYASGGNENFVLKIKVSNNKLGKVDTMRLGKAWPEEKICPTGVAVDQQEQFLYTVTKEDSALYVFNIHTGLVAGRFPLGAEAYACILSPDGSMLYISVWGADQIVRFDVQKQQLAGRIPTGNHPNELLLNKNGAYLFVANANDNSVSVINTGNKKVLEIFSTSLYPTQLTGSTTNGLALSQDENTLYIANADNNCLAVFDVSHPGKSKSKGFIPVGWYPTNVKTLGNKILVANGKGFTSMANPKGPQPVKKEDNSGYQKGGTGTKSQYIGGLFWGTLSFIPAPTAVELKLYTAKVFANSGFKGDSQPVVVPPGSSNSPILRKPGNASPVKYVFYVIKENRTYDQVLGDQLGGNGDTALCIFPRRVTPNQHALTDEFVLLDNFYVDAEVSADGHNWSTAAYANDFVEKTWPTSYGNRGGNYDFEGSRKIAYPRDGFIWDYCQRAGVTYRTYGEFAAFGQTYLKSLEGHMCDASPGFDMDITDITREQAWAHDFDSLLAEGAVPQFNTIRLSNDHTSGQRKGKITPTAAVADNDLAAGMLVEHLSKSRIWKESLIIMLEDDAQNGPDHIDAHRSTIYIAGGYVKRHAAVHRMYGTSGVLRTIELILGLPPMSQYDAAALPLYDCFSELADTVAFTAKPAGVNLDERNVAVNGSSRLSEGFTFNKEDEVPDLLLNEVVWKSVKGETSSMPAPVRRAFVLLEEKKEAEKDD